jgi:hypothetical protein
MPPCFIMRLPIEGTVASFIPSILDLGHAYAIAVVDIFGCEGAVANLGQAISAIVSIAELVSVEQVAVVASLNATRLRN